MTGKTTKLNLIEGIFPFSDAREILVSIYKSKINFHQKKNMSSQERFGHLDETAEQRIPLLTKNLEQIHEIIKLAETQNKKIHITSSIQIDLIDE